LDRRSSFAFQTRSPEGVTSPASYGDCVLDLKRFPNTWASNSKYVGQIERSVNAGSGALILAPGGDDGTSSGWEWKY
jgi:hypothetical protein